MIPAFDGALGYPWHSPEAQRLHAALTQAIASPQRTQLLYLRFGPDLRPLDLGQSPDLVWKSALDGLIAAGKIEPFCRSLRDDRALAALIPVLDAVLGGPSTTGGSAVAGGTGHQRDVFVARSAGTSARESLPAGSETTTASAGNTLTWLHISDFHIQVGKDPYDQNVVLRALVAAVENFRVKDKLVPELIFATGDIAHWGKAGEYALATRFFDDLLKAAALPKEALFVIPGNHDVDRTRAKGLARTLQTREEADDYFAPGSPRYHTAKLAAFTAWYNEYFKGIRAAPAESTCGPAELFISHAGYRLGILPLNSALFCLDDNDHNKLWLGHRCLKDGLAELKALKATLNVGLIHHPLDWLSPVESPKVRASLLEGVDVLLRGHLHETEVEAVSAAEGATLRCAAGAAYQTRLWPNRALYGTFDGAGITAFPIEYRDSPRELWTADTSVFPFDQGFRRRFPLARMARAASAPAAPSGPAYPGIAAYLDRLIAEIEEKAKIYSPLRGIGDIHKDLGAFADLAAWKDDGRFASFLTHHCGTEPRDYKDVLLAYKDVKRAAVLGDPGAGKSTTLRKLALDLAKQAQTGADAEFPVFADLGNWTGDEPLGTFLAATARELDFANLDRPLVLLLDGLNEMPTAKRKGKAEEILQYHCSGLYVTCRAGDYTGDLALGFDTLKLEPLTPQRVRAVLEHWAGKRGLELFWQLAGDPALALVFEKWLATGASEDEFWKGPRRDLRLADLHWGELQLRERCVNNPRSLLKLAANPFLLTMFYQVWLLSGGQLPKNRGDLFRGFVECLLSREKLRIEQPAKSRRWVTLEEGEQLLAGLAEVAWRMQRGSGPTADSVVTTLSRAEVLAALGGSPERLQRAQSATVLEPAAYGSFRFCHQLLQEYFAALALDHRRTFMKASELWPPERWWERSGWEETAVLLAGLHPGDCTEVLEWLMEAQPEVALQCLAESGAALPSERCVREALLKRWKPKFLVESAPRARAAIGRALGAYDLDDRPGTGIKNGLPDIAWVPIAAGKFIYQEEKKPRTLPAFGIAKYPVTNKQFQAFLDAPDGYANDENWAGLTIESPDERQQLAPCWSCTTHPRETVSWFEAMAFCRWLSKRSGAQVTLPTEEQWERAARGTEGREYPWGNTFDATKANTAEGGVGTTSAVGIYPGGASPEGVCDLSGDVWEWCLDEWGDLNRTQPGGRRSRGLRGGSWYYIQGFARAAFRYNDGPDFRNFSIGFRVVCLSPIPH